MALVETNDRVAPDYTAASKEEEMVKDSSVISDTDKDEPDDLTATSASASPPFIDFFDFDQEDRAKPTKQKGKGLILSLGVRAMVVFMTTPGRGEHFDTALSHQESKQRKMTSIPRTSLLF